MGRVSLRPGFDGVSIFKAAGSPSFFQGVANFDLAGPRGRERIPKCLGIDEGVSVRVVGLDGVVLSFVGGRDKAPVVSATDWCSEFDGMTELEDTGVLIDLEGAGAKLRSRDVLTSG